MSAEKHIGLLWHSFSSNNLGVGALSVAHVELLEEIAKEQDLRFTYTVIGTQGTMNYLPEDVKQRVHFLRFSPKNLLPLGWPLMRAMSACDAILDIGEGDSFTDIYGATRFAKQCVSKLMASMCCRKVILAPQTIGPFRKPVSRSLAKLLINRSASVWTRDALSTEHLESLAVKIPHDEASDLAFRLRYTKPTNMDMSSQIRVGINVSGLLFNGGYSQNNQFGLGFNYSEFIISLLETLINDPELEVHLVPHVLNTAQAVEDDAKVNEQLRQRFHAVRCAPPFSTPSEAKSYIASLDYFLGSRMHATIAAFSSATPVTPLAYSRKFRGLYESIGYHYTIDATQETNPTEIIRRIRQHIQQRHELRDSMTAANHAINERLEAYKRALTNELTQAV